MIYLAALSLMFLLPITAEGELPKSVLDSDESFPMCKLDANGIIKREDQGGEPCDWLINQMHSRRMRGVKEPKFFADVTEYPHEYMALVQTTRPTSTPSPAVLFGTTEYLPPTQGEDERTTKKTFKNFILKLIGFTAVTPTVKYNPGTSKEDDDDSDDEVVNEDSLESIETLLDKIGDISLSSTTTEGMEEDIQDDDDNDKESKGSRMEEKVEQEEEDDSVRTRSLKSAKEKKFRLGSNWKNHHSPFRKLAKGQKNVKYNGKGQHKLNERQVDFDDWDYEEEEDLIGARSGGEDDNRRDLKSWLNGGKSTTIVPAPWELVPVVEENIQNKREIVRRERTKMIEGTQKLRQNKEVTNEEKSLKQLPDSNKFEKGGKDGEIQDHDTDQSNANREDNTSIDDGSQEGDKSVNEELSRESYDDAGFDDKSSVDQDNVENNEKIETSRLLKNMLDLRRHRSNGKSDQGEKEPRNLKTWLRQNHTSDPVPLPVFDSKPGLRHPIKNDQNEEDIESYDYDTERDRFGRGTDKRDLTGMKNKFLKVFGIHATYAPTTLLVEPATEAKIEHPENNDNEISNEQSINQQAVTPPEVVSTELNATDGGAVDEIVQPKRREPHVFKPSAVNAINREVKNENNVKESDTGAQNNTVLLAIEPREHRAPDKKIPLSNFYRLPVNFSNDEVMPIYLQQQNFSIDSILATMKPPTPLEVRFIKELIDQKTKETIKVKEERTKREQNHIKLLQLGRLWQYRDKWQQKNIEEKKVQQLTSAAKSQVKQLKVLKAMEKKLKGRKKLETVDLPDTVQIQKRQTKTAPSTKNSLPLDASANMNDKRNNVPKGDSKSGLKTRACVKAKPNPLLPLSSSKISGNALNSRCTTCQRPQTTPEPADGTCMDDEEMDANPEDMKDETVEDILMNDSEPDKVLFEANVQIGSGLKQILQDLMDPGEKHIKVSEDAESPKQLQWELSQTAK